MACLFHRAAIITEEIYYGLPCVRNYTRQIITVKQRRDIGGGLDIHPLTGAL